MKKTLFTGLIASFVVFIPIASLIAFMIYQVFFGSIEHLKKDKVVGILSKETILYYDDSKTQLGSLFGQEHRIYVPIHRIPKVVKDAIISAEDDNFYSHHGIDPKGAVRAVIRNVFLGKREGASTITQQTVKNLYGRVKTNLFTKFTELINAFKLERLYDKDQILEFYLNQFHVTGNGRGIGIAAKYYFKKNVENLDLLEAAFIAGSVKAPGKYNPFTKMNPEAKERAIELSKQRKNYVLSRMLSNGRITQKEYDDNIEKEVPFNMGRFQFNALFINNLVEKQLSKPDILEALDIDSPEELESKGLKITTTLKKDIQYSSLYALRKNLSNLQMTLTGFQFQTEEDFSKISKPRINGFYTGFVESINTKPNKESLIVSFGLSKCHVGPESLNNVGENFSKASRKPSRFLKQELLKQMKEGLFLLVSIKEEKNGELLCDLEVMPRIQGGIITLDKGKIISVVGGFSETAYNRAIYAQRQSGSTFKTMVYYAAQQLGWSVLDPISNIRDVYAWQGLFYFPRPDHIPQTLETTMLGAGAKSENLASVWILKHALDKLTYEKFFELLTFLGIIDEKRTERENLEHISKKFNAHPYDIPQIISGIIEKTKVDLLSDISFTTDNNAKIFIRTLHYGYKFDNEIENLMESEELEDRRKEVRINLLRNNFLRWQKIKRQASSEIIELADKIRQSESLKEDDLMKLKHFKFNPDSKDLAFFSEEPWDAALTSSLAKKSEFKDFDPNSFYDFVMAYYPQDNVTDILLDGFVPIKIINYIDTAVKSKLSELESAKSYERLYYNDDFKYSVGMYYVTQMMKELGIKSPTEWVPSMPLGAGDITLAELAMAYQTILTGKVYRYFKTPDKNQITIIKRIEDSNGNLLWEAGASEVEIISNTYSPPTLGILRSTVSGGTSMRRIRGQLTLKDLPESIKNLPEAKDFSIEIPSLGKTGTTNDHTNGIYIGFLPYPTKNKTKELSPENAYTIASYVGYDNNEPMVNGRYRIYGGTGAIPAWLNVAKSIVSSKEYYKKIDIEHFFRKAQNLVPINYGNNLLEVFSSPHSSIPKAVFVKSKQNIFSAEKHELISHKNLFHVFLKGHVYNDVFIPKHAISFFNKKDDFGIKFQYKTQDKDDDSYDLVIEKESDLKENIKKQLKKNELDDNDELFEIPPKPNL